MNPTKKTRLYPVEVWMQPEESCYVRITLASGAVWLVPLKAIIDETQKYYEENGWDEPGGKQPTGDELRGLMLANYDEDWALECDWKTLRADAIRLSGKDSPPDDLLWAVDEANGALDFVTTLTPKQQRKSNYVLWSDTDPATWKSGV